MPASTAYAEANFIGSDLACVGLVLKIFARAVGPASCASGQPRSAGSTGRNLER